MASLRTIIPACATKLARKQRLLLPPSQAAANQLVSAANRPSVALFSTKPPNAAGKKSSMNPFTGMWDNYQDGKTRKAFREQMEDVQKVDQWTLGSYMDLLGQTAKSWKSKIPGVSSTSEVKNAKESYDIVEAMVQVMGADAKPEDIQAMGRKEKLKAANGAGVTVERINQEIQSFGVSNQTHILVMILKEQGKPLPETQDEMRNLVQIHAKKLLSKEEKNRMMGIMQKNMMKDARRGRR